MKVRITERKVGLTQRQVTFMQNEQYFGHVLNPSLICLYLIFHFIKWVIIIYLTKKNTKACRRKLCFSDEYNTYSSKIHLPILSLQQISNMFFACIVLRRILIVRNWIEAAIVSVFGDPSTDHIFGITFKTNLIRNIMPHELYETAIYFYTHFLMFASVAESQTQSELRNL